MSKVVLPGSRLGILGSGQLGRMTAIAARRLGYRVEIYSPDAHTPAGQVSDKEWVGEYDDEDQLAAFARGVDVVTLEFENISLRAIEVIERHVPVRPGALVLGTAQNRLLEKSTANRLGLATTEFRRASSLPELAQATRELGGDVIAKTVAWGYDGKGQRRIRSAGDVVETWNQLGGQELIVEQVVDFVQEFSVIGVRGVAGEIRVYSPFLNVHRNHILDTTVSPSDAIPPRQQAEAEEMMRVLLAGLEVCGVLCVEFFLTQDGRVLINEMAPRPHNSGHLTIDAHRTCQFEQLVRAACGLPLGSVEQIEPAAMANLLGDIWEDSKPDWSRLLEFPHVKLHMYGKAQARPGRKMGHVTALAQCSATALQDVLAARAAVSHESAGPKP